MTNNYTNLVLYTKESNKIDFRDAYLHDFTGHYTIYAWIDNTKHYIKIDKDETIFIETGLAFEFDHGIQAIIGPMDRMYHQKLTIPYAPIILSPLNISNGTLRIPIKNLSDRTQIIFNHDPIASCIFISKNFKPIKVVQTLEVNLLPRLIEFENLNKIKLDPATPNIHRKRNNQIQQFITYKEKGKDLKMIHKINTIRELFMRDIITYDETLNRINFHRNYEPQDTYKNKDQNGNEKNIRNYETFYELEEDKKLELINLLDIDTLDDFYRIEAEYSAIDLDNEDYSDSDIEDYCTSDEISSEYSTESEDN